MNLPAMGPHYGKKWTAGRGEAVAAKKSCARVTCDESETVFRLPPEIYEKVIYIWQDYVTMANKCVSMFRFCRIFCRRTWLLPVSFARHGTTLPVMTGCGRHYARVLLATRWLFEHFFVFFYQIHRKSKKFTRSPLKLITSPSFVQFGLDKLPSWKELFKILVYIPKFSSDRERIRDAFSVLRGTGFNAKM